MNISSPNCVQPQPGYRLAKQAMGRLQKSLLRLQKEASRTTVRKTAEPASKRPAENDRPKIVRHQWSDGLRTIVPVRPFKGSILIVGDGDLSYSRSLAETHGIVYDLIATVFEGDRAAFVAVHGPKGAENVDALVSMGVSVHYGVDVRRLSSYRKVFQKQSTGQTYVSCVIFNFPHTGEGIKDRAHNIRAQQRLLASFFAESAALMAGNIGPYVTRRALTLQVGKHSDVDAYSTGVVNRSRREGMSDNEDAKEDYTDPDAPMGPEIHVTLWSGDPYDDWKIREIAHGTRKVRLQESFAFDFATHPMYHHCRTAGSAQSETTFSGRNSRTYVFVPTSDRK